MKQNSIHLSDEQILSEIDGEISAGERKRIRSHLDACWRCRARSQQLGNAIAGFIHVYDQQLEAKVPSAMGPRALLKARLEQLSGGPSGLFANWFPWALSAVVCTALIFTLVISLSSARRHRPRRSVIVSTPEPAITPGAALMVNGSDICAANSENNKAVPSALQRRVLEAYGLEGADPRLYEIDYLVTPALGGSDDIHNLWPHSYSATIWNAKVKDALESRLRQRVCDGSMDLATAQREIAGNWIAAYQKYFQTKTPLAEHEK